MAKKTLKARDVERLENTSFATLAAGPGGLLDVAVKGGGETCTCDCKTCTCCLPDYDESDLCCNATMIQSLGGRCYDGVDLVTRLIGAREE